MKKPKIDPAKESRIRAALRWTEDAPKPDVEPPEGWRELTTGYTFNAYTQRVDIACSSPVDHAIGRTDKTTTQGARWLYSTRERAFRALRATLERSFAEQLEAIDRMMEETHA